MSNYEFLTKDSAHIIPNWEKECKRLESELERAHEFIFKHYPDHFKAWSVKNERL